MGNAIDSISNVKGAVTEGKLKQHVDRAQNGRGTYFILSRRHWQETRGLLIISRRSCAASFLFPFSTSCLVFASLSLSPSRTLARYIECLRIRLHAYARVCACIDLDVVPIGIWLVLLMSIRQLSSMNGVGGYLAHTAVVPGYLPSVSMATNRCF